VGAQQDHAQFVVTAVFWLGNRAGRELRGES
jgi:hypothetical protein